MKLKTRFNLVLIGVILIIGGASMNVIVITENGGMPIRAKEYQINDDRYIPFQENSEVDHWYFSDIINLKINKVGYAMFSIGDLILIGGMIFFCYHSLRLSMDLPLQDDKKSI